jgi:hypothetical protein
MCELELSGCLASQGDEQHDQTTTDEGQILSTSVAANTWGLVACSLGLEALLRTPTEGRFTGDSCIWC